ncbi:MAG: NAD(P)H-binding protein [Microthrixaceae bacterium]
MQHVTFRRLGDRLLATSGPLFQEMNMLITIAGGHGTIARQLTRLLVDDGHRVPIVVRKPDQFGDIEAVGGTPVLADLEAMDAGELADVVGDADAVVFAAGSGPGSGAERKETVDHRGAVLLIDAAKRRNVAHYVIISSMGADAFMKATRCSTPTCGPRAGRTTRCATAGWATASCGPPA